MNITHFRPVDLTRSPAPGTETVRLASTVQGISHPTMGTHQSPVSKLDKEIAARLLGRRAAGDAPIASEARMLS